MGFNDLMHPRNIYRKSPPDFKILAENFDYFRKFAKETKPGRFTLNFKDPEALRKFKNNISIKQFSRERP